jgi:hypothetical protein
VRTALKPLVNEFEVWMPPETRCVRALCAKRSVMAIFWPGLEDFEKNILRGCQNSVENGFHL